jgi:hypothetical protein
MRKHDQPKDFDVEISGRMWRIEFVRRHDARLPKEKNHILYGVCDWTAKKILVRYDVTCRTMMDVLAHEVLHATNAELYEREKMVEKAATNIARVLNKAGYRRVG